MKDFIKNKDVIIWHTAQKVRKHIMISAIGYI